MKESTKLLLIYVTIGLVAAIVTAYFLYQDREEHWNEYARKSFTEVLRNELQKREIKDVPFLSWGSLSSIQKDILPDDSSKEIAITSEHGEKTSQIPTFKLNHNIEDKPDIRAMHSYILEMHPLVADSLNLGWTKSLQEVGFSGRNVVRVSVIDLLEQETKQYSGDSLIVNEADSLCCFYIGYRSEIEVTGFLYLPWWKTFFLKDIILLCGIVMLCFLLPIMLKYINRFYHTCFVKTEVVTIEKQISVVATEKSEIHIYQLDAGVLFDYDSRELRRSDKTEPLTSQLADLLKLFLEADDYLLTTAEIAEALWPNTMDAKNNIYSAIRKLRTSLSHISHCTIDNKNSSYQLKIPYSIEEND